MALAPARVAADFTFASSLTTLLIGPMYSRIATSDAWFTGLFHCVLSVDVMANTGCCLVLSGLVGKTKNAEEQFASVGGQVQKRHERQIRARLVEAARSKPGPAAALAALMEGKDADVAIAFCQG